MSVENHMRPSESEPRGLRIEEAIIYSVLVPQASVPALFAAGMIPGILAGIALLVPIFWLSKKHGFGLAERDMPRPPFWRSFRDAIWA